MEYFFGRTTHAWRSSNMIFRNGYNDEEQTRIKIKQSMSMYRVHKCGYGGKSMKFWEEWSNYTYRVFGKTLVKNVVPLFAFDLAEPDQLETAYDWRNIYIFDEQLTPVLFDRQKQFCIDFAKSINDYNSREFNKYFEKLECALDKTTGFYA